jgi:DUF177 domain-containing protein
MPEQVVIDGLEFARTGMSLRGQLYVNSLERIQDSLASGDAVIEYSIQGGHNPRGRPLLHIVAEVKLILRCQRCLGPLVWPVSVSADLLLLQNESEYADLVDDDSLDEIVAAPKMDVAAMVEDEIILRLPFAPRHAEGECEANGGEALQLGKESPFATLAKLKK